MSSLLKIFQIIYCLESKKFFICLFSILINVLLDFVGIASVFPFLMVLSNPDSISKNFFVQKLYNFSNYFGFVELNQFVFFIGCLMFSFLSLSLLFKVITHYLIIRFTYKFEHVICKNLLNRYLSKPYEWFLEKNTSDLSKNILAEVKRVVAAIMYFMIIISQSITFFCLLTLLFLIDTTIAMILGFSLTLIYIIVFYLCRNYLKKIGNFRQKSNEKRYSQLYEAFGLIKFLKVRNAEEYYLDRFSMSSKKYTQSEASSQIIGSIPRYLIEGVAYGFLIFFLLKSGIQNFLITIPTIGIYILIGFRLLPGLQQIYSSYSGIHYYKPTIERIYNDLDILNLKNHKSNFKNKKTLIEFNKSINLIDVSVNFNNQKEPALSKLNLEIPFKTKVAIVGKTGSGKTTLVDTIIGLITPKEGQIFIDDEILTKKNLSDWHKKIAYVPQNVFLTDDSIIQNIAFGVKEQNIDFEKVINCAKIANIHDFIINNLEKEYQTKVGDKGIRLSGGQIQRLGIARAFYNDPKLIILDEATNALDGMTESSILDSIIYSSQKITTLIISHKIKSLKNCDKIVFLENGKIIDTGNFDELILRNMKFRSLTFQE
jgi:ABC-type multidrug transport system fused ATPase/permease subunit